MFKLFLLFCALAAIPLSDAVHCFSCTGVESEKQCMSSINCGSNVVSCKKELYYKNGKHLISKGCHSIDYEKNDECINSRFTDGPNKGDFERCLCTGDKCNGASSMGMNLFTAMIIAFSSFLLKNIL
nr:uncharacterized protein LOC121120198 [Lepeophtheirus salmonis]